MESVKEELLHGIVEERRHIDKEAIVQLWSCSDCDAQRCGNCVNMEVWSIIYNPNMRDRIRELIMDEIQVSLDKENKIKTSNM